MSKPVPSVFSRGREAPFFQERSRGGAASSAENPQGTCAARPTGEAAGACE